MRCVRCLHDTAGQVATAPDGSGAWEMYYCQRCNFSWRSTEEEEVINPDKRDPWFQLDKVSLEDILNATPSPIPPLRKS